MAARMAVIMSWLVGSLSLAPAIRSSADCGSSIDWLIPCGHRSLMMWSGWLEVRGREGRFFFPTRDAVLEIGAGVGLLA